MREMHSCVALGDCLLCSRYFPSAPEDCVRLQEVSLRMAAALLRYAEKRQGARVLQDCAISFDHSTQVRPDIVLVRENRSGIVGRRKVHGAPDLAVEIACGCNARDLRAKQRIYSTLEIREVWVVDPESEKVDVLAWTEAGYALIGKYRRSGRICSPLLPDLKLPLRAIFRREK